MSFLETSAKDGLNIEEVFITLCTEIASKIEKYDHSILSPTRKTPNG